MARQQKPTQAQQVEQAMERWWNDRIHNSPVSQFTPAYNHIHDAYGDLKKEVKAILSSGEKTEVSDDAT